MTTRSQGGSFRTVSSAGVTGVCVLGLLVGCVTPNPETATTVSAPKTPASKTFTSFSPALRCMDDLMLAHGKREITITTAGIKDATQKVSVGTKEMLIRALNMMSRKSKAFSYIDYDQENAAFFNDAQRASGQAGFNIPSYYIRGAITQLDDNTLQSQAGASIATPFMDLGLSKDQIVSLVSVDLNVGETVSRQVIADAGSSNTMAVVRGGTSGDGGGKIGKVGLNISISLDKSEGLGSAVRALVELGAIETMGQFTHTPYWKCLQIEKTNPKMLEQARDWYDSMQPKDQIAFVQRKLAGAGLYKGEPTGAMDPATVDAISRYQNANQLIANGRMSFELYFSMLDDEAPMSDDPSKAGQAPMRMTQDVAPIPVRVTSDRGDAPTYRAKETLTASVELGRNAFLYCFYQDADNVIVRLFPNRFQPNAYVTARSVALSSDRTPAKIRFDKAGRERVACMASDVDVAMPAELKQKDLTPLKVESLDQIGGIFRAASPRTSESRLEVSVQ
ncbi:MAG: DUF4384 domain-containing protein [Alphaproteobacteria bacterium]